MSEALAKNGILVSVHINCAGYTRKDRAITDKVNNEHGATGNAGKYDKNILDPRDVDGPQKAARAARAIHDFFTVGFGKDGFRYLPIELLEAYNEKMDGARSRFTDEVEQLKERLPGLINARRQQLNGMFNEADYSHLDNLDSLYGFEWTPRPIGQSGDLIADIVDEEVKSQIAIAMDEANVQCADAGHDETVSRFLKAVAHINECLTGFSVTRVRKSGGKYKNEPSRRLFDSMITNLADLVEIGDALNIKKDPQLAAVINEIRDSELLKHDVETFRDPEASDIVETVQSEAADLAAKLAGFTGKEI